MSWLGELQFDHPGRFWLLLGAAALAVGYLVAQARRGRYALRFSDTALLETVAPARPGWRRHVVAATFLAAAVLMITAFAVPFRQVVPFRATIVLTIDTSLSMGADDVTPSRLDAAKEAALDFLSDVPDSVDVAIVSFDEFPVLQVGPTADRIAAADAIRGLELGPFTATGDAISASVQTILDTGRPVTDDQGDPTAVVVLLSDGAPTVGKPIDEAIAEAVDAGIEIDTVALGTAFGSVEIEDPDNPGTVRTQPVPVDEVTMESVALGTGGEFFRADTSLDLSQVYRDIGTALGEEPVRQDEGETFLAAALLALALTGALSVWWFQRLP